MFAQNKNMKVKKLSQEHIEKLRQAKLGKPRAGNPLNWKHSKETKNKLSLSSKGRILSNETRKKISLANKGKNGSITLLGIIITSAVTLTAAIGTAWITSGVKTTKEIGAIETKIQLVEQRENLHYEEIQKSLNRIENLIEKITNPKSIKNQQQTDYEKWINTPAQ